MLEIALLKGQKVKISGVEAGIPTVPIEVELLQDTLVGFPCDTVDHAAELSVASGLGVNFDHEEEGKHIYYVSGKRMEKVPEPDVVEEPVEEVVEKEEPKPEKKEEKKAEPVEEIVFEEEEVELPKHEKKDDKSHKAKPTHKKK